MGKQGGGAKVKKVSDPGRTIRNKKRKQENHEKRILYFSLISTERDKLLTRAYEMFKVKRVGLQKIVGTLNFNRLSDVVSNTYLNSQWYKERELKMGRKYARKNIQQKNPTENQTVQPEGPKVQEVHDGSMPSDANS